MTILDVILLSVLQGLTEFLPVSSSGHLVLGEALLGGQAFTDSIAFEIVVHLGTFLAVLVIFWNDIRHLLRVFIRNILRPSNVISAFTKDKDFRLTILMIIAMLPAGFAGLFFRDQISSLFSNPHMVGGALIVTGSMLMGTRFIQTKNKVLNIPIAIIIGMTQALALIPGISRSGSTISMALLLGISQKQAARFSFIMVLPLILAATLIEILDLIAVGVSIREIELLLVGFVVSFGVGWVSLRWLLSLLRGGKFFHFAWYCFALGLTALWYF